MGRPSRVGFMPAVREAASYSSSLQEAEETVLYSFCAQTNCADGANPHAGLVFDQKGNLYGTTYNGGVYNYNSCYYGCGVVFKLTP